MESTKQYLKSIKLANEVESCFLSSSKPKILKICLNRFFAFNMFTKSASKSVYIFSSFILLQRSISVTSSHIDDDLKLTFEEKHALVQLKTRAKPILPHAWMKQEIYLIRWLRARDYNVNSALQMLKNNLYWRNENKIDSILNENWTDLSDDYPYTNDSFDREGRPVITINMGIWNVRTAALHAIMPRLQRYMDKILEEGAQKVISLQKKGKRVSQFKILIDLDGFSLLRHGCLYCLPLYTYFANSYEQHYPGQVDKIIYINTPPVYELIINLMRPFFSQATRESTIYMGQDSRIWMTFLDNEISRTDRRYQFGGSLS